MVEVRFDLQRKNSRPQRGHQKAKRQRGTQGDDLSLGIEPRAFGCVGWKWALHEKSVCSFIRDQTPMLAEYPPAILIPDPILIGHHWLQSFRLLGEFFYLSALPDRVESSRPDSPSR